MIFLRDSRAQNEDGSSSALILRHVNSLEAKVKYNSTVRVTCTVHKEEECGSLRGGAAKPALLLNMMPG